MRFSRTDLVPVLTIMVGGVIGASLSFSFLALSPLDNVPAPERPVPSPVVAPATAVELLWVEVAPLPPTNIEASRIQVRPMRLDVEGRLRVNLREFPGLTPEEWQERGSSTRAIPRE